MKGRVLCLLAMALIVMAPPNLAAEGGAPQGALHARDADAEVQDILRQAESGDPEAQYRLGLLQYRGEHVPADTGEAMSWFLRAATQGNADAQFALGVIYYRGHDETARDYAEALRWFTRAAEQGHPLAQYNIGVMYHHGQGVPVDYGQAYTWYSRAAAQGDEDAMLDLQAVIRRMTPDERTKVLGAPATALRSVSAAVAGETVEIHILADGPVTDYAMFTLHQPDRIVYDLPGMKSPYRGEQAVVVNDSPCVVRVRYYSDRHKIRVVLDSDSRCFHSTRVMTMGEGLLIRLDHSY